MAKNVRTQNLRDFTVQIRHTESDEIVGTGITVSTDGKIVTCAHVVEAAGVDPCAINGDEIGVYFPQARGGEQKKHRAKLAACFALFDDDMVLLQLGSVSPLSPEQIAVLGTADGSERNQFLTYGYSQVGNYQAVRADGKILGSVEPPIDKNLQVDPIQLQSRQIAEGMSGAAVLDVERNLVVGLVAERYFPEGNVQDDISFSADAKILTFPPLDFTLRGKDLELKPAPTIKLEEALIREALEISRNALADRSEVDKYVWHAAPSVLGEFTGREVFLEKITEDWDDPKKHITGLIGFGGEGKSSLARKWVDDLLNDPKQIQPDGIFWWGFYENRSVDEFFEAALKYMSGDRIDPKQIPSASMRAQVIASMLGSGRYLFVLDGLEVMQHQDGDQYGLIQSNDLRDFLTYFAAPDHESFCLVTSRAPLLDLMAYTTYTHRDVNRLLLEDGIDLLKLVGVRGGDEELGQTITQWDGHALTVSLLGSYLADHYDGDIAHLEDIPAPEADEPRYERVHRVLRRYDEHLTEPEREFLKLFAAFRTPVHEDAFENVFEPLLGEGATRPAQTGKKSGKASKRKKASNGLDGSPLHAIVSRLLTYRLLRHDAASQTYTAHPLIRNHYLALLSQREAQKKGAHEQIKEYYLSIAGDTPQYPTLDDLRPLIEVVHHACRAGAYDAAWETYWNRISQQTAYIVVHKMSAHETELSIIQEFFPKNDTTNEPQTSKSSTSRFLINQCGFCLMSLGRLREAVLFYERVAKANREAEDWSNTSNSYRNIAHLYSLMGALDESGAAARQAFDLARRVEDKEGEHNSLFHQSQTAYLQGKLDSVNEILYETEKLYREIRSDRKYLTRTAGILHADYLQRIGNNELARKVTEINLTICADAKWAFLVSQCHRVLGDLDTNTGDYVSAREHYESALKIARGISFRPALIEALLSRGKWYARHMGDADAAFSDLNEGLSYAVEGEYRIYEADIRVALAWAHLTNDELSKVKDEAERALSMSKEMGYHWGQVDAKEVLEKI